MFIYLFKYTYTYINTICIRPVATKHDKVVIYGGELQLMNSNNA